MCRQTDLTSDQPFSLHGHKNDQNGRKGPKSFSQVITYDSRKLGEKRLHQRLSLVETHLQGYIMWNLNLGKVMVWLEKVMLRISRFIWTRRTHCRCLEARISSQSRGFAKKTAVDLWWRHMTWNACCRGYWPKISPESSVMRQKATFVRVLNE